MKQRIDTWIIIPAVLVVTAGVAACDRSKEGFDELDSQQPNHFVYSCVDGYRFSARLYGDSATVDLGDRVLTLPRADLATGGRFEAGGVVLHVEGGQARLDDVGTSHEDCEGIRADNPWAAARLMGITFRAVGQEPGWTIDIVPQRQLRYSGDYGATRILFPAAEPVRDDSAGSVTFQVDTTGHSLVMVVRTEPCQDSMSGEEFTHSVEVQVNGDSLRGCGRGIPTGDLTGTYWRLVEMEGNPVAAGMAGREAYIRFDGAESRVGGSTGCNQFGGTYEAAGDSLRFGQLIMTRMACLEGDLMQQEQRFQQLVSEVDRFAIREDSLTFFVAENPVMQFVADYLR
jgi:heat shock protein HslJ